MDKNGNFLITLILSLFDYLTQASIIWMKWKNVCMLCQFQHLLFNFFNVYCGTDVSDYVYFLSKAIFFPVSESKKTFFNHLSEFLRHHLQLGCNNHSSSLICQLSYFVTFILTKITVNEKFGKSKKIFPLPLKFTMRGWGFPLVENPWPNIFHRGSRY